MAGYLSEKVQADIAILGAPLGGATATQWSKTFTLKDYSKVTVHVASVPGATGAAAAAATFSILVGHGTEFGASNMAALSNATLVLGNTSALTIEGQEQIYVCAHNSVATGVTLVIDGSSFTFQTNGTLSDKHIAASLSSAVIKSLASLIATYCTHLETRVVTTGATNSDMIIFKRDLGAGHRSQGIDITMNAHVTTTGIDCRPYMSQGIIEFTAGDVLATNSSYTRFAIQVQSAVTVANYYSAVILREPCYPSTYGNRTQL